MKIKKVNDSLATHRIVVDYDKKSIVMVNPRKESKYEKVVYGGMRIAMLVFIIFMLLYVIICFFDGRTISKELNQAYGDNVTYYPFDNQLTFKENTTLFGETAEWHFDATGGALLQRRKDVMNYVFTLTLFNTLIVHILILIRTKGRKKDEKSMMEFVMKTTPKYYMKFEGEQKSEIVETPAFNNEVLLYETEGDYNNLKRIEVKELPVERMYGVKNSKREKCYRFWTAKFIFRKIPKQGFLEIKFK